MDDTLPAVTVRDAPGRSRYEAVIDDEVVGFADYHELDGRVVFLHVEVRSRWEGRGVATRLVGDAFDSVVARGKAITPVCPFAVGFVRRHPEYKVHTG